jgi:hypothetical protein
MSHIASQLEGGLAKVRERSRDIVRAEIAEIDVQVAKVLRMNPVTAPTQPEPVERPSLFDLV